MAKRFTDTDKWKKSWFRKLNSELKLLFFYVVDNCNHAGIFEADWDLIEFMTGNKYTESDMKELAGFEFKKIDSTTYFLLDFVLFQQNISSLEDLNEKNNSHKSIISELKKKGLISPSYAPHEGPCKSKVIVKLLELMNTVTVSYTHLTLPTKRIV